MNSFPISAKVIINTKVLNDKYNGLKCVVVSEAGCAKGRYRHSLNNNHICIKLLDGPLYGCYYHTINPKCLNRLFMVNYNE